MQKKKILILPILFLCYEESACSLLLNYNKVYFAASLIAKPSDGRKNSENIKSAASLLL